MKMKTLTLALTGAALLAGATSAFAYPTLVNNNQTDQTIVTNLQGPSGSALLTSLEAAPNTTTKAEMSPSNSQLKATGCDIPIVGKVDANCKADIYAGSSASPQQTQIASATETVQGTSFGYTITMTLDNASMNGYKVALGGGNSCTMKGAGLASPTCNVTITKASS